MWHCIRVYTVKVKKFFTIFFENYNLTPLDMYNGLSNLIVSNQKEESISILRVNLGLCRCEGSGNAPLFVFLPQILIRCHRCLIGIYIGFHLFCLWVPIKKVYCLEKHVPPIILSVCMSHTHYFIYYFHGYFYSFDKNLLY